MDEPFHFLFIKAAKEHLPHTRTMEIKGRTNGRNTPDNALAQLLVDVEGMISVSYGQGGRLSRLLCKLLKEGMYNKGKCKLALRHLP